MSETPNTGIPYVPENTLDPAAGLNLALNVIDALLQTAVLELGRNDPPGSPSDGDLYIIGAGTGVWSGQDDNLARYVTEGAFWQFYTAGVNVHIVLNREDGGLYSYSGTAGWQPAIPGSVTSPFAPVVTESGDSLAATPANAGNYTRLTHAAPVYTFDGAETYMIGAEYHGRYAGSGTLEIAESGGMTLHPPAGGSLLIPPGGTFTVKIIAAAEADLFGVTQSDTGT